jgi:transcriptional regulator with XRE-family HTH domain
MPRPPKHVPPDTLGGRIRAARENLHLSLAEVAARRYSTSLLSQIERNRVEPSQESLEFLASQLQLPLDELKVLAQQQRESDTEAHHYMLYEALRTEALQALAAKRPYRAHGLLEGLNLSQIPSSLRWRLVALRGQCSFTLRQFLAAQKDFIYAVTELPEIVPADQHPEAMLLHLHLAAALRELEQLEASFEQYQLALKMMDSGTALNYIAEAHWGISLVAFERANLSECSAYREAQLKIALEHAKNACILYRSIGENLRDALLTCQIGLIEQALGKLDDARKQLREILQKWMPELDKLAAAPTPSKSCEQRIKEMANVISAAACSLAGIELEAENYADALTYVQQARQAGQRCYILRRAEAEIMLGRILETINVQDTAAAEAFRKAIKELAPTDRLATRIRAHDVYGRHLLKKGETKAGEAELDKARRLSHEAALFSSSTISVDGENDDITK